MLAVGLQLRAHWPSSQRPTLQMFQKMRVIVSINGVLGCSINTAQSILETIRGPSAGKKMHICQEEACIQHSEAYLPNEEHFLTNCFVGGRGPVAVDQG